jgi:hypothetical protein
MWALHEATIGIKEESVICFEVLTAITKGLPKLVAGLSVGAKVGVPVKMRKTTAYE